MKPKTVWAVMSIMYYDDEDETNPIDSSTLFGIFTDKKAANKLVKSKLMKRFSDVIVREIPLNEAFPKCLYADWFKEHYGIPLKKHVK